MDGVIRFISEIEFGLCNAWIFLLWQSVLPIVISTFLNKNRVSSKLFTSAPVKHGQLLDFSSTALVVISVLYSVFLPLKPNTIWFIPGLMIFIFASMIIIKTVFSLRHAESGRPFTAGMYRYSRHPFYFSMGLIYNSITMMSASWIFLIFTILFIIQLIIAASAEERSCLKIYGEEYQAYLERTPRWIGMPKPIARR